MIDHAGLVIRVGSLGGGVGIKCQIYDLCEKSILKRKRRKGNIMWTNSNFILIGK